MRKVRAAEELPTSRGFQNDGKWQVRVPNDMPVVTIADVLHDELASLELFFRMFFTMGLAGTRKLLVFLCESWGTRNH